MPSVAEASPGGGTSNHSPGMDPASPCAEAELSERVWLLRKARPDWLFAPHSWRLCGKTRPIWAEPRRIYGFVRKDAGVGQADCHLQLSTLPCK
jgi:hypothetical protein